MTAPLLAILVQLSGVTGEKLTARAFVDANNVKVGDPLILTVDFLGKADFTALHPPALARTLDKDDWKLDSASAKTDTSHEWRRLTWRLRPRREGLLWFPAITYAFNGPTGDVREVTANAIPVHVRKGQDVEVAGLAEDTDTMPEPDALILGKGDFLPADMTDDDLFAWRKACSKPTADAFAKFDFPAAKLNEAACAIEAGDWKRALRIYRKLEWRTGQTPTIEHGIRAALARRYDNPAVELPVWRQVGRPLLRYGAFGRFGLLFSGLALIVLLFWSLSKLIRKLACVAFALMLLGLGNTALAQDPFEEFERMSREMHKQMNQMMQQPFGGGFFSTSRRAKPVEVKVTARTSKPTPQVGESFDFILHIEAPKTCTMSNLQIVPTETFGMQVTGNVYNLTDLKSKNPTNVIHRVAVPVRYDVPYNGVVGFSLRGMITGSQSPRRGFSFTFSNSFEAKSRPLFLKIKPLPTAGQPKEFAGIIADSMSFSEATDLRRVGTNDVVRITYTMHYCGFLPEEWMPEGAAFMIDRQEREGTGIARWQRYFVADGTPMTPKTKVVWYNPQTKKYQTTETGNTPLVYTAE